jgi:hypothetical protein
LRSPRVCLRPMTSGPCAKTLRPHLLLRLRCLDANRGGGRTAIRCMFQAYIFKSFRCFRGTLQVFHTDVAKVDWDVAYVAMVVHVYCKSLSPCFICFPHVRCKCIYLDVAYVSHICCKCFIWMLRMAIIFFKCFFRCFLDACFKCFICLFLCCKCLHLNVSKVDRMLHMRCTWEVG